MVECIQSALHCPRCLRAVFQTAVFAGAYRNGVSVPCMCRRLKRTTTKQTCRCNSKTTTFSWHEPTFIRLVSLPRAHECICYIIALKDLKPASTVTSAKGVNCWPRYSRAI